MVCTPIILPGGLRGMACGRRQKPKACSCCGKPSTLLCDFPVKLRRSGTCDKPLCEACAVKGPGPDLDYCPGHGVKPAPPP